MAPAGSLSNLPKIASFDLWFVKNVSGTGRTAAPEVGTSAHAGRRAPDRLLERRTNRAGFRDSQKALDNFDFDLNKKMNRRTI